jgi:hypothetical protein
MSFRAGTRSLLLGLAALLPSASVCGARSDLAIGGHEACADSSRAGAVGCTSIAFADMSVALGDVDGDGKLDLVLSYVHLGEVSVLLNRGCAR